MKEEKETKQRLLESAKAEFLEKGYMSASLRNICRNAHVTTGALYFFFQDKEDLFASLVEEPLHKLLQTMTEHYQSEVIMADGGIFKKDSYQEDLEIAYATIHYIYQYYDELRLVLTKSQGSGFENYLDVFVNITEQHYRKLADQMSEHWRTAPIPDEMIHWIAHMQIDVFVHFITHGVTEEHAATLIKSIMQYLITGWFGMFQTDKF